MFGGDKSKYLTISFIILILIIILFAALSFSEFKYVDAHYAVNPNVGEKVQFDGEYVGITSWGDDDVLYYVPPTNYDVIKLGGEYVFLCDDWSNHNLYGHNVTKVHLEGEFLESSHSQQPMDDGIVIGHFFNASNIEVID